jgi:peptide subunit release factor 1 (eRF1)
MSQKIGGKVDELLIYKEGETTHGGTFKCVSCGSTIKLSNPGHIPKCSECDATEFRRA